MLGYAEEEIKNLSVSDIHPEKDLPLIIEIFDKQAQGELSTADNLPVRRKDGSVFYADITVSPIVLSGNKMLVGSFRDVTTRKKVEDILKRDKEAFEKLVQERTKELVDAQVELERNKRLSDIGFLAATVAHELRNPLATISMAAYGIKQEAATPGIKKHLASIEKKIKESDQIISNLLFYSRLKPPHYENVSVFEIIEDVISAIKEHREKYVEIIKNTDSLKSVMAIVDPLQIKEVFSNILNNAFDAIAPDKGRIEIAGNCEGKDIKFIIKDNGKGMSKETLEKIFEPFFTTKAKGTGLGLVVCRQVINLHNGSISFKSEIGKGTTVMVTFSKERTNVK